MRLFLDLYHPESEDKFQKLKELGGELEDMAVSIERWTYGELEGDQPPFVGRDEKLPSIDADYFLHLDLRYGIPVAGTLRRALLALESGNCTGVNLKSGRPSEWGSHSEAEGRTEENFLQKVGADKEVWVTWVSQEFANQPWRSRVPKISIIITGVTTQEDLLRVAANAKDQGYPHYEILFAHSWRLFHEVAHCRGYHCGQSWDDQFPDQVHNRLLERSGGDIITFASAKTRWEKNFFQVAVNLYREGHEVVYHGIEGEGVAQNLRLEYFTLDALTAKSYLRSRVDPTGGQYLRQILEGRHYNYYSHRGNLIKLPDDLPPLGEWNPLVDYIYVMKEADLTLEEHLSKHPQAALVYLSRFYKNRRCPRLEGMVQENPRWLVWYVENCLGGERWPENEVTLKVDVYAARQYAAITGLDWNTLGLPHLNPLEESVSKDRSAESLGEEVVGISENSENTE